MYKLFQKFVLKNMKIIGLVMATILCALHYYYDGDWELIFSLLCSILNVIYSIVSLPVIMVTDIAKDALRPATIFCSSNNAKISQRIGLESLSYFEANG